MAITLGVHTTVFQSKVMGVMFAARTSSGMVGRRGTVTTLSDSKDATRPIVAHKMSSCLVLDCRDELESHQVDLVWVPEHSGVGGNEDSDKQAR